LDGRLSFAPRLPSGWKELAVSYDSATGRSGCNAHDEERYLLEAGAPLDITIRGSRAVAATDIDQCPRSLTAV